MYRLRLGPSSNCRPVSGSILASDASCGDVSQRHAEIRVADRLADHHLIGVRLADQAARLCSGADPGIVRKEGLAEAEGDRRQRQAFGRHDGQCGFRRIDAPHRLNEFAGLSRSVLSNPIWSRRQPRLYRSHGTMSPSMATNGVTKLRVMLFAVTFSNGPYTKGSVDE